MTKIKYAFLKAFSKKPFLSLNLKLAVAIVIAALLMGGTFLLLSFAESVTAEKLYLNEKARNRLVNEKYVRFRDFVKENNVKGTDSRKLQQWVEDQEYTQLIVYDSKHDLFSAGWLVDTEKQEGADQSSTLARQRSAETDPGSEEQKSAAPREFKSDLNNRIVKFADQKYCVYLNVSPEYHWYDMMDILKIVLSAAVFLLVILLYNRRVLRRVIDLSDVVYEISEGDLDKEIRTGARDEIGNLASSVDTMRNSIIEKMNNEKAAFDANTQLITAMSHDIRTPLTSLIGYLDIIEGQEYTSEEELRRYIASCRDKAFQLKDLSDKLFRYFLVFGKDQEKELEEVDGGILFQQILVEHVAEVMSYEYKVELQYHIPEGVMVEVDISAIRRLFDNLFSIIMKYANFHFPVEIKADVIAGRLKFVLQNHIWEEAKKVESTRIGVRTCKKICEDMHATFHAMEEEKIYTTEILFPIRENKAEEQTC